MLPKILTRRFDSTEVATMTEKARHLEALPCGASMNRIAYTGKDNLGSYGYTLTWLQGVLTNWTVGTDVEAEVVISHDGSVRVGDWRGGFLGADDGIRKDFDGWDVSGIPSARINVMFADGMSRDYSLRWSAPCLHVDEAGSEGAAMTFSMTYLAAMEWFWGDLILGHLIWRDTSPLRGNVFALSAVEGIVSAPTLDGPPPDRIHRLKALAALFQDGAFDKIAELIRDGRGLPLDSLPTIDDSMRHAILADQKLKHMLPASSDA